jgi:hypothetical protein
MPTISSSVVGAARISSNSQLQVRVGDHVQPQRRLAHLADALA